MCAECAEKRISCLKALFSPRLVSWCCRLVALPSSFCLEVRVIAYAGLKYSSANLCEIQYLFAFGCQKMYLGARLKTVFAGHQAPTLCFYFSQSSFLWKWGQNDTYQAPCVLQRGRGRHLYKFCSQNHPRINRRIFNLNSWVAQFSAKKGLCDKGLAVW